LIDACYAVDTWALEAPKGCMHLEELVAVDVVRGIHFRRDDCGGASADSAFILTAGDRVALAVARHVY